MALYPWETQKPGPVAQNNGWFQGLIPKLPLPPTPKLPMLPRTGSNAAGVYGAATANYGRNMALAQGVTAATANQATAAQTPAQGAVAAVNAPVNQAVQTVGKAAQLAQQNAVSPQQVAGVAGGANQGQTQTAATGGQTLIENLSLADLLTAIDEVKTSPVTLSILDRMLARLQQFASQMSRGQYQFYQSELNDARSQFTAQPPPDTSPGRQTADELARQRAQDAGTQPTTPGTITFNNPRQYTGSMGNTWADFAAFYNFYTNGAYDFSGLTGKQLERAMAYLQATADAELGGEIPSVAALMMGYDPYDPDYEGGIGFAGFLTALTQAYYYGLGLGGGNPYSRPTGDGGDAAADLAKKNQQMAEQLQRFLSQSSRIPTGSIQGGGTTAPNTFWY